MPWYSMSRTDSECARIVTKYVPDEANRYRWHILRYLRMCTYPAGLTELSEHIGSQVGAQPLVVRKTIRERDLPALAECGSIKYDSESELACLQGEQGAFTDHVRRALAAGVISHLKPLRLVRSDGRVKTGDKPISE
jgi:hypothetical protein